MTCCPDCATLLRATTAKPQTVSFETYAHELWCPGCETLWIQETGENPQGLYRAEEQPDEAPELEPETGAPVAANPSANFETLVREIAYHVLEDGNLFDWVGRQLGMNDGDDTIHDTLTPVLERLRAERGKPSEDVALPSPQVVRVTVEDGVVVEVEQTANVVCVIVDRDAEDDDLDVYRGGVWVRRGSFKNEPLESYATTPMPVLRIESWYPSLKNQDPSQRHLAAVLDDVPKKLTDDVPSDPLSFVRTWKDACKQNGWQLQIEPDVLEWGGEALQDLLKSTSPAPNQVVMVFEDCDYRFVRQPADVDVIVIDKDWEFPARRTYRDGECVATDPYDGKEFE
jgi:hypothetical protein